MEVPRVSGTSRALLREGEGLDLEKLRGIRDRKLKNALRTLALRGAGGGDGKLSWGSFVEGVEEVKRNSVHSSQKKNSQAKNSPMRKC